VLTFHETIEVYEASDAEFVVADTVYRTVRTSSALTLPATVDVLDSDGTLHAVPVTWDGAPARSPSRPGQVVVSGTTAEHGPVTAVVDVVRRALATS
jgi:arabinogalactan endo-1,4-beta-galactosidase